MLQLQSQAPRSFRQARTLRHHLQAALGAMLLGALAAPSLAATAAGAPGTTDGATQAKPARTTKLGHCSSEAKKKGLKGDDRKKFISDCIKSS